MEVESFAVYSLDRCIKCLGVLNLGERSFCSVVLRKGGPGPDDSRAENPGT
jgi:hypothetical protein